MQRVRIKYLDAVRILACLLIISVHAPMPGIGINGTVLSSISLLATPSIGLLFMVSGALLLPVQESSDTFLKKRLTKVVFPTLFWCFFYLLISVFSDGMTPNELIKKICSIPFSTQGHSILWFMYTLIGLYLLSPIISPWLQKASKKEIEWVLLLWAITFCYPILSCFIDVNETKTGILYYFSGFAGYFLLGYYLHTYKPNFKIWQLALLFIVPIVAAIICKLYHIPVDFYKVFWNQSIVAIMMCTSWFCIFQRYDTKMFESKWITQLSNCCFGIYLVHIFIMRSILWKWDFISGNGGIIQIILTILLTSILSFSVVWCISKLPYSQYIIGYKSKK